LSDLFSAQNASRVDSRRVYEVYEKWPSLAREGFGVKVERTGKGLRKAYVLGMGGSASGGDIIVGWMAKRPDLEMAVFKGQLPVGDMSDALAIACSASGQTEETIEMLHSAVERHATVVSIGGGGRLKDVSESLGIPFITAPKVIAPRYMLPFFVFSTLAVVNKGLGLGCEEEAEDAFSAMDAEETDLRLTSDAPRNGAKSIASSVLGKTPAIYAARITRGVGIRFKNVLNENAKIHAHFDGIPDAFHNEIEAWEDPRTDFLPIFLRHPGEADRDRARADKMFSILSGAGKVPLQVNGRGATSLARLMSMVYRLDMTSYYVAIGLGRDPFPVRNIDTLKKL